MSRFWQHFITNGGDASPLPATAPGGAVAVVAAPEPLPAPWPAAVKALRPAVVGVTGGRNGTGSGVLITPDGFLLTSHHLVRDQKRVRVRLADGREAPGRVVGSDPVTDLAVVQAEGKVMPFALLGNSQALQVGGRVAALAGSRGEGTMVRVGSLTSVGRPVRRVDGAVLDGALVTDIPASPGHGGGPLADERGRVLGLVTALVRPAEGRCCAIPAHLVQEVLPQLLQRGRVTRGYLGLRARTTPLVPSRAEKHGLQQRTGVLVAAAERGGPADRAGILEDDMLVALADAPLAGVDDLMRALGRLPVGVPTTVTLLRGERKVQRLVVLAESPEEAARA